MISHLPHRLHTFRRVCCMCVYVLILGSDTPVLTLSFIQTPPTPNPNPRRKTPEFTYILLLLLRLKEQGTDLMVTINIPHYPGEYQKATEEGGQTQLMKDSAVVKEKVLESFEIKEWGLFEG